MMKFNSAIDRNPAPDPVRRNKTDKLFGISRGIRAIQIPTVDEVDDVISFMTADTVIQILRGDGIYWGWRYRDEDAGRNKSRYDQIKSDKIKNELSDMRNNLIKIPSDPFRDMKWSNVPEQYRRAIRAYQVQHKVTRQTAQSFLLPILMASNNGAK